MISLSLLVLIAIGGLWCRFQQRTYFAGHPSYGGLSAVHIATAKATREGKPFHYVEADREAALQFLFETDGAFGLPLSEYDREAERFRAASGDSTYLPYFGDQSGWGIFLFLTRLIPGVDSLAGASAIQIFLDIGALLLLYPLGIFITGRRYLALGLCALYAFHLPLAYAAAEPYRESWPGFAVIYGMGLMLPAWKRGPAMVVRSAGWLVAAGLMVGLMTYGRSTAVTTPITLGLITFLYWRSFRPAAVASATVLAATLITLAPWMIFTYSQQNVVAVSSAGGGHALLLGLGEEPDNPLGLRFDDRFVDRYIREVCDYDVEFNDYSYSAACTQEARRFISDHKSWYASLLGRRILGYVKRPFGVRLKWGFGTTIPVETRARIEQYLAPLGMLGLFAGFLWLSRTWIPLLWILHFWVFTYPMQSHPRLLLGAEWALLAGVVILVGSVGVLGYRGYRRFAGKKPPPRTVRGPSLAPAEAWNAGARPQKLLMLGTAAFAVDLIVVILMAVFHPVAPPDNEWRKGLADPDSNVRLATIDNAARWGPTALPVLVAGLSHDDEQVRRRAGEVIRNFVVTVARMDFAGGELPGGVQPRPGVTFDVQRNPAAENGFSLRVSTPRASLEPIFALSWPHTRKPGPYKIVFRGRLDDPVLFSFRSGSGRNVRSEQLYGVGSFPMTSFDTGQITYENTSEDDTVMVVLEQRPNIGETGSMTLDLDWIVVLQELAPSTPIVR